MSKRKSKTVRSREVDYYGIAESLLTAYSLFYPGQAPAEMSADDVADLLRNNIHPDEIEYCTADDLETDGFGKGILLGRIEVLWLDWQQKQQEEAEDE